MASSGRVYWYSDTLTPGMASFPAKLHAALSLLFDRESRNVQDYMRSNAPWTDRTSNARNGLFAKAISGEGNHVIVCYHTMPYGVFLELKNSGEYAIIIPTIQAEGKRVMRQVKTLMKKMA